MSALDVAALGIGSKTVLMLGGVAVAGAEDVERVLDVFQRHTPCEFYTLHGSRNVL